MRQNLAVLTIALCLLAAGHFILSGCSPESQRVVDQKAVDKLKRDLSRVQKQGKLDGWDAIIAEAEKTLSDNAEFHEQKIRTMWVRAKQKEGEKVTYHDDFVARAKAAMVDAIKKFPARLDLRFGLSSACRETGDFAGELAAFRDLCEYVKANPSLTFMEPVDGGSLKPFDGRLVVPEKIAVAVAHYAEPGMDESLEKFYQLATLSAEFFPHDFSAQNALGAYHQIQGDPEKALEHFKIAYEIIGEHSYLMMNLGKISVELDKKGDAINYYERVLQLKVPVEIKEAAQKAIDELMSP
jgi:tetratricopeptide (TPR) repeat protein